MKITFKNTLITIIGLIIIVLLILYIYFPKLWNGYTFYKDELFRYTNYLVSITWGKDKNEIVVDNIRPKSDQKLDLPKSSKFVAGAAIDIFNDGREAIFIGGNRGYHDALLLWKDGEMVDIIKNTGLDDLAATHSAVSIDLDKDGYSDLIIARQNGVFLYKNSKNGTFKKSILLEKQKDATPLAITISDFDKDGHPDIHISQFVDFEKSKLFQFHNKEHSKQNTLLKGQGNGKFIDITKSLKLDNKNNTFTSIFTDINNDKYPDIININDTGKIGVFENIKGKMFKKHDVLNKYGSYMGIAAGDIDEDGDQDYYISNIGNTMKITKLSRGDLKSGEVLTHDHILLRNDGNFKFIDIAKEKGINNAGFSWGAVYQDLNLDSYLDLLVSQNFDQLVTQKYAPLPSQRWLYSKDEDKYIKTDKYANRSVGQSPLTIDIDGDGIQDIVWINMFGPIRIHKILNSDKNNYINIKLPDTLEFANAKVTVKTKNRSFVKEYIIGGTGFASDMSQTLQFGLGKIHKVDKVSVNTIYGKDYTYDNPKINTTIVVRKNKQVKNI